MYTSFTYGYVDTREYPMLKKISPEEYNKQLSLLQAHEKTRQAAGEALISWLMENDDAQVDDDDYNADDEAMRAARMNYARGYNKARSEALMFALEAALTKPEFDDDGCHCDDDSDEE